MKPQEYLNNRGKSIFKEIVKHCPGTMPIDSFIISQTAHCLDMMHQAITEMDKKGYVQPTKNGYDVINGHFTAWKESSNRFDKYCRELGLSNSAREKIEAFANKKEDLPDIG